MDQLRSELSLGVNREDVTEAVEDDPILTMEELTDDFDCRREQCHQAVLITSG
ncbi:hypothetical protein KIN20_011476 [Parelaphostrongylus tenuis]|uniref:Uncharacterized protein n=1 Tax=Parelaphostrongylus tenuis TaxID=148309 RepID=A0AAD5QMH6_PARTN|nr:hypothetical protein KIN20_011476 [Parelaphostrongylus tenuis]